ncbi:type 2 periplasmic-binding domain-containing protein [Parenemella sanctibonifatiensis]|nr:hypothetical protein [Parenemella sanctibonifatiensis]
MGLEQRRALQHHAPADDELPQSWGVNDDGTFTSVYTLPEYREALAITRQAFVDGLFHPNAASATYSQFRDHFYAGQTWMLSDGSAGWDLFERTIGDRGTLGAIALPAWDGDGDAGQYAGKGYQLVTTISNRASEDRLPLILKVLDYFAAPIGSLEHLQRKFGQEGTDFTWEANGPRLTEVGQGNFMDFQYFIDSPTILGPGDEEAVRRQHEWHSRVSENLVHDPSIGLVSETQINKGGPLATMITDAVNAVVYDRGPIEDFDSALTKWRNDGGDQIAEEFATAYAERDDA